MKRFALYLFTIITFIICLSGVTYAFWDTDSLNNSSLPPKSITIGDWNYQEETTPPIYDDYDLDIWVEEENINQVVPEGQIFKFEDDLYISTSPEYNPAYHGLPDSNNPPLWAFVSIELEWQANKNYRVNSVVTANGRYFIANSAYTTSNWFVNSPLTHSGNPWSEWREIEPISEEHFPFFENSNIRDYANPDWNYIIYK